MLVGHRCLFKLSHPDCQPLGVGGLAEDRLEISFNRRLEMPELETLRTELCSGGVCAAACLDSWEVFGTFSMFLGADWGGGQWGVVGWVAGMLVFAGGWEGVCLAMPCQGAASPGRVLRRAFLAERSWDSGPVAPGTPVP